MLDIRTVTVIGVTGTMGANIAGLFASFGDAKVYCVGRSLEKVRKTLPRIIQSVRADAVSSHLIPVDFSMLEKCVAESDLVFESVQEDLSLKKEIAARVGRALRPGSVSGTGTSGLSVTEIAECYPESQRERFFGIHLFNPPYTLPLCELTATKYSDRKILSELKSYLREKLLRTVVDVKDSPAFLANRIGFQFINEALLCAKQYQDNGGIDYVDAVLGSFTGRTMPPLATSDFVGLDIHQAIVRNLYQNTNDWAHETFILPDFAQQLISEKQLGRKSGGGLYRLLKNESGIRRQTVYDIHSDQYRDVMPYVFPFAEEMKKAIREGDYLQAFRHLVNNHSPEAHLCLRFLLRYILYALFAVREVGFSVEAADDVMAAGFNWCPPLALYQALSAATDVPSLVRERLPVLAAQLNLEEYLADIPPSKYDYRRYFKSGRSLA